MSIDIYRWIDWVWITVGIYWFMGWLVGALRPMPIARREKRVSRVFHIAIMALAFGLLFSDATRIGVLGARFVPDEDWLRWAGLGITVAGCAFAVWARALLGSNWSATVTVKQHHELIRRGPYAIVRHPIYSGFLLGIVGTALALGEVRGVVALALGFLGWSVKARTEEQFLLEEFGAAYIVYCREVKQLIPFIL
jgi:protein-S-isoprenylcysteine O-methyltransferase Ste14